MCRLIDPRRRSGVERTRSGFRFDAEQGFEHGLLSWRELGPALRESILCHNDGVRRVKDGRRGHSEDLVNGWHVLGDARPERLALFGNEKLNQGAIAASHPFVDLLDVLGERCVRELALLHLLEDPLLVHDGRPVQRHRLIRL